jgi:energy-coupling factor transporter transmembrane protein EcfT
MTTSRVGGALNPIAKLAMLVCCCTVAFHLKRLGHAVILSGIILLSHGALRIPLDILWRRLRGIVMFALILFLSQLLLVRGMPWHAKAVNGGLMALRSLMPL